MTFRRIRLSRNAMLAAVSALALSACAIASTEAWAGDLPASPDGAQKLTSFFATYFGKQAKTTVTPAGSGYDVAYDLGAAMGWLATGGISFDPALLKYHVVQQDDGTWRVEQTEIPPLTEHVKDRIATIAFIGVKSATIVDPAIGWFRNATAAVDKMTLKVHAPDIDENFEFGALQGSGEGKASSDGVASATMHQTIAGLKGTIVVAGKGDDAKPTTIDTHSDALAVDLALDGVKSRALLDLWAFLVAHPSRPELASNEANLKTLLAAVVSSPLKLNETIALNKFAVDTPQGPVTMDAAKIGVGGVAGTAGALEEHFAVDGLSLPATLVPAQFRDLTPTSFTFGFRASGFNVAAGGAEAVADMHLDGDGPAISLADQFKIDAKLISPDGIVVDVAPSHILAPALDIAFEGRLAYNGAKPTGALTVHMHNFDKTQAAIKALGPEMEKKLVPTLAMAKGLAKSDPDGTLNWIIEIGPDRVVKVNGLPLGKSPL